jgi:hypothetical protein
VYEVTGNPHSSTRLMNESENQQTGPPPAPLSVVKKIISRFFYCSATYIKILKISALQVFVKSTQSIRHTDKLTIFLLKPVRSFTNCRTQMRINDRVAFLENFLTVTEGGKRKTNKSGARLKNFIGNPSMNAQNGII